LKLYRSWAVGFIDWLDRRRCSSKGLMCFSECFQCDAKLFLCLVAASAQTRECALCNLFKLGAPLRVLTPETVIDSERCNKKNAWIVIAVREWMERKPLQRERHDELQAN